MKSDEVELKSDDHELLHMKLVETRSKLRCVIDILFFPASKTPIVTIQFEIIASLDITSVQGGQSFMRRPLSTCHIKTTR